MHILLIHQAFAALDEPGGTRHIEIARVLAEKGHQVTIITSPVSYLTGKSKNKALHWKSVEQVNLGVRILRVYTYPALHRSFFHRVLSFLSFMFSSFFVGLSVKDVDLIWGTSPPIFQGWTAWLLARLKRVPFLFEIRDLWPAFAVAVGVLHQKSLIKMSLWLERFLYRRADVIVVNSPGFIDHIQERGGRDIRLVENGVDPSMFQSTQGGKSFRIHNGLQDNCVILYAGAHGISNDLTVVLGAAELLKDENSIKFVFVGDGKEKPALVQMADEKLLTNTLFLPSVPKSEMTEVIAGADACLAILKPIDLYKTTYPNKVFDYMAAGKPVLLAIDGVIREIVEKANGGIFVEPGNARALADAVLWIKDNPGLAEAMGNQGKIFVTQNFHRTKLAEKFEQIALDLIKGIDGKAFNR
jgi:glycosyltransferase involved in cell wall biosynthesis